MLLNTPITKAYVLREKLLLLWNNQDKAEAEKQFTELINELSETKVNALIGYSQTLQSHKEGILNYCDYQINSGKLEGTNNKIKVVKRMAYGFQDIDYFGLKIKQQSRGNFT